MVGHDLQRYLMFSQAYCQGFHMAVVYEHSTWDLQYALVPSPIPFNPSKTELLLNYIEELSPYLTGNALRIRYKDQPFNAV
jgi:hypothetical protein